MLGVGYTGKCPALVSRGTASITLCCVHKIRLAVSQMTKGSGSPVMGGAFYSSLHSRDPIAPSCLPSSLRAAPSLLPHSESSWLGRPDRSFMQEAIYHTHSRELGAKTGKGSNKAQSGEGSALISPCGSEDSLPQPIPPFPRAPAGPCHATKGCLGSGPVTFL